VSDRVGSKSTDLITIAGEGGVNGVTVCLG
jgi:hypothetical protein